MITQSFLTEFEIGLLKAFAKASRTKTATPHENFATIIKSQEAFMSEFTRIFGLHLPILEKEIVLAGHNPVTLLPKVQRQIDSSIRTAYMKHNALSEAAFKSVLRDLKTSVRSSFYEKRL